VVLLEAIVTQHRCRGLSEDDLSANDGLAAVDRGCLALVIGDEVIAMTLLARLPNPPWLTGKVAVYPLMPSAVADDGITVTQVASGRRGVNPVR